jgi:DNA-binding protein HU-beta
MNKAGLIDEVADKVGITKKEIGSVIDAVIESISKALEKREKVTLVGFGTFQIMERKPRRGRNPQTGQVIQIPAKNVAKFKAGKGLKEKVG